MNDDHPKDYRLKKKDWVILVIIVLVLFALDQMKSINYAVFHVIMSGLIFLLFILVSVRLFRYFKK